MWAPVINQWQPKPVWGLKKLVIKGRDIKFDSLMPVEQLAAEIIHATDHFVMGHKPRREDRDKSKWQTSACIETIKRWDEAIKAAGLEWAPGTDVRDQHPDIKRNEAEKVYDEIEADENQTEGEGEGQEGNDLGDDDGDGEGDGEGKPGQGKPGKGKPGQGQPGQGQPGDGQPGQGQPGKGQPGKGQPGDAQKGDKGEDGDGVCRLEDNDYDDSMLDELGEDGPGQDGDGDGDGDGEEGDGDPGKPGKPGPPGKKTGEQELARQKEEAFNVLARKIVQRLLKGTDKRDYSLSKPSNRSSLTNGGVLSSLNQKPAKVGIIIDVSGSVDDKMRNAIFRVAEKIQRQVGNDNRITVATGDTEVKDVGPMRRVFDNARGGGGTAMEVVIPDAVRRMRGCDLFLIITDGETAWPSPEKMPRNALVLLVNDRNPNETTGWYNVPPHIRRKMMWVTKEALMKGGDIKPHMTDLTGHAYDPTALPGVRSTGSQDIGF